MTQDDKDKLEQDFERARAAFTNLKTIAGARQAQEAYSGCYQRLVKAGLRMQIKGKYRGK